MKVNGTLSDFAAVRTEGTQIVISYGLNQVGGDLYEWHEVSLNKTSTNALTLDIVKNAILGDINHRTDAKILNGYEFTPDGAQEPIVVWLSKESQTNFSEAHRLQIVPVRFKLNETEDKQPIYHTFETFEELDRFYKGGVQYINQCLNEGWQRKDAFDWQAYQDALDALTPTT